MSELDLPLEEPWQDIRELDVYDINGEQIGSVEDLCRSEFAPSALPGRECRGLLGMGKKHLLVPIEAVNREVREDRVTVDHDRDKVVGSPDFDPKEVPKIDVQRAVYAHYGYTYPQVT